MLAPERGADSVVWLASAPDAALLDGDYVVKRRVVTPSRARAQRRARSPAVEITERLTGETWPEPLLRPPGARRGRRDAPDGSRQVIAAYVVTNGLFTLGGVAHLEREHALPARGAGWTSSR